MNWQNKISGFLGLLVAGLIFADFSDTLFRGLVVAIASIIIIISFFGHRIFKTERELIEMENREEKEDE